MKIEKLAYLRDNPIHYGKTINFPIKPISIEEIEHLERIYNNDNLFPQALRELLYLAGKDCYVLDYSSDNQEELQTDVREWLSNFNRSIARPFFAIDAHNPGEQFLYVYLDESDDPTVYQAYLPIRNDILPFTSLQRTLSDFIKVHIDLVKKGYNPF
ncbi:hypothetical protein GKZ90_0014915 [Flavobacterium sp. MC2016-06]|uniref:hypothetical protein n=1 Tax=Flavobacterium sp. MC2016-06 TaxID=2676308 RepID=UPI0012BB0B0B|nr:hypothetical protein [Flavobacterium sp. MC2016-06]MBU3859312.1 hypothetical protein [Flavobacterium sp. MC2016-06]